jgi:hypothetical protein
LKYFPTVEGRISVRLLKSYSSCRVNQLHFEEHFTKITATSRQLLPVVQYYIWLFAMIKLHNDACDVVHAFPRVGQFRQLHSRTLRFIFGFQYGNSIPVDKRI